MYLVSIFNVNNPDMLCLSLPGGIDARAG